MKQFIFLIFTISLLSGCHFLGGKQAQLSEDSLISEEEEMDDLVIEEEMDESEQGMSEDEEWGEEEMDEEEMDEEEMDEEGMDEEGMDNEEMDEEGMDEDWDDEEDKPKKGFFARLFGGSEKESVDELEEELDSEFIGEDEDFSSADRDYEDYEESESVESTTDATENIAKQINVLETEGSAPTTESNTEPTEPTETAKKQYKPLNKIMTVPYTKAGQIINAVYIARSNEDLSRISQAIYGRNEVNQLLKINSHLQNRKLVVGDKIYYNSPNRPNDNSRLLYYYQDNNISPSYYNLSPGDNIRQIASQLLGHPKSWKEIWATNPNLQSKSTVEKGLSIAYWPQSAMQIDYNEPVPAEPLARQPEPSDELTQEPMPAPAQLEDDFRDPQKNEEIEEFSQPIPENSNLDQIKEPKGIIQELLNNVEIIVGIVFFLILLYLIIRIIMNKRKQRDFDYTATNIEM